MEVEGLPILFIPLILYHFVCCYVAAEIATNRNRATFGWAIMGLLCGFFGVALIYFLPKTEGE